MASLLFIPLNNTSEFSIRESHHSQTFIWNSWTISVFNHIRESHHSQTMKSGCYREVEFNHIRESHHSQTHLLLDQHFS